MKRLQLIPFIKEKGIRSANLTNQIIKEIIRYENLDEQNVNMKMLHETVMKFLHKVREKIQRCNRMYDRFLLKEEKWLQEDINVQYIYAPQQWPAPGRPRKSWEDLGERSKRQKIAELSHHETYALAYAAMKSAKADPTIIIWNNFHFLRR